MACGPGILSISDGPEGLIYTTVLPYISTFKQHQKCQFHHVPVGASIIMHHVQSHGNMGVTVVTTQVMLEKGKIKITV
jgi:hypothetical protein